MPTGQKDGKMKTVFQLFLTGKKNGMDMIRKNIDLPFAPWVGMKVFDSALHPDKGVMNYYTVKDVMLMLECGSEETYLFVTFEDYEIPEDSSCEDCKNMFKGHGWTVSFL